MTEQLEKEIFKKSLVILGVGEEDVDTFIAEIYSTDVSDIKVINELLVSPKKGEFIFPMNWVGYADIYKVCAVGPKKTTLKPVNLLSGVLQESPVGSRYSTEQFKYRCLWVPDDLVRVSVKVLCSCKQLRKFMGLSGSMAATWWRTFQIANLAEAYRDADKRKTP